eukprot:c12880_g1_i1.p1 GENE.c12880_g1_i1~~c12880_g1_i1.p1  ORF type:complete len:464 (+),score=106.17 c12880_g1_i1:54-1394(+)
MLATTTALLVMAIEMTALAAPSDVHVFNIQTSIFTVTSQLEKAEQFVRSSSAFTPKHEAEPNTLEAKSNAPPLPSLPNQFVAQAEKYSGFLTHPYQNVTLYYDLPARKSREDSFTGFGEMLPNCFLNNSLFANATNINYLTNDLCRPMDGEFANMWGFMVVAQYIGQADIRGIVCDVWYYTNKDHSVNLTMYNQGNTPVRFTEQVYAALPGSPPQSSTITYDFITVTVGPQDPNILNLPESCLISLTPCDASDGIQSRMYYVAHPPDAYNITDQDVADLTGDVGFTCNDVVSNHTEVDHYGVVSLYNITLNTRWGIYSFCNGYNPSTCIPAGSFYVGRESSFGCFEHGGQCDSDNPDASYGFWYSLPAMGLCTAGQDIYAGDCTWMPPQRIKTVSLECLLQDQGMLDACLHDPTVPFVRATKIFSLAFASSDPTLGGCPDVPPPSL